MTPRKWWVVMQVLPWDSIEMSGIPVKPRLTKDCPFAGFIPVFATREEAERWANGRYEVVCVEEARP